MAETNELRLVITGDPSGGVKAFEDISKIASEFSKTFSEMAQRIAESGSMIKESISSMAQNVSESRTAFSSMSRSTTTLENRLKTLSTTMSEYASATGTVKESDQQVAESLKTVADSITLASRQMNSLRSNMNRGIDKVGGLIAVQMLGQSLEHIGQVGQHLFDAAIQQGADFQQTMKEIQVVLAVNNMTNESWNSKMQDSVQLTDQLQQLALQLGSRGAQSALEVGQAVDSMLRSGVTAQAVLGGAIKAAQDVSIVTGDSLDESGQLISEIFHQFREQFATDGQSIQANMRDVGNVLSGVLLNARVDTNTFLDSLKYVGPVASQLHSSFSDVATATALMAQNGIKGSQAGNNLKRVFTNLLEPTKAGADAMAKLGLIVHGQNQLIDQQTGKMLNLTQIQQKLSEATKGLTDAQKAQFAHDVFGQYALAGSLVLLNANSGAYQQLKEKIDSINSSQAAASMLDTFNGHLKQLAAHLATTAKEFGMSFIPVLEKLIPIGNKVLDFMQNLPKPVKEIGMGALAIGSAFVIAGGALMTFGMYAHFAGEGLIAVKALLGISKDVSLLGSAFSLLTNPWVLLVAAIITGAILIWTHWHQIVDFAQQHFGINIPAILHTMLDAFTTVFNAVKQVIDGAISYVKPVIMNGIATVSSWWSSHWSEIHTVVSVAFKLIAGFVAVTLIPSFLVISAALGVLAKTWKDIWNICVTVLKTIFDAIVAVVKIGWDLISGYFSVFLDLITGHFGKAWSDMRDTGKKLWSDIKDSIVKLATDMKDLVLDQIHLLVDSALGIFNGLIDGAKRVWDGIKSLFGQHISGPTVSMPSVNMGTNAIPKLAQGAVIDRPTLAWIGEGSYPEAVVPLKNGINNGDGIRPLSSLGTGRLGSTGGRVVQFNGPITIQTNAKDAKGIAQALKSQLNFALR